MTAIMACGMKPRLLTVPADVFIDPLAAEGTRSDHHGGASPKVKFKRRGRSAVPGKKRKKAALQETVGSAMNWRTRWLSKPITPKTSEKRKTKADKKSAANAG
ncbi:MAG: hypothetical protein QNI97_03250 [Desulfobacterales bacterium]|nr:hypothetical protein [Desulfobacterales bacterium]